MSHPTGRRITSYPPAKDINITEGRNLTKHWRGYIWNLLDEHPTA